MANPTKEPCLTEPIVVECPPCKQVGQGDCADTVTVQGVPVPPPGQCQPVKRVIRMPYLDYPIRQPIRPWRQCIENTLINDAVRRPMARWCHKRPLPPIVLPKTEVCRLHMKGTEKERKEQERRERIARRECQRKESRRRQAEWNNTVESVLDRKKQQEDAKELEERQSFQQLLQDIKNNRDAYSDEQIARAKKLTLYRKGLIRDFHSAMAFSKMMQDMDRLKQKSQQEEESPNLPVCETKCMKKMIYEMTRLEGGEMVKQPKKINERLLNTLKCIESRKEQQETEMNCEVNKMWQVVKDNLPPMPEAYVKQNAKPKCEETSSQEKFLKHREEFCQEIDDKLATDAYIESHEKEVERQACEYTKYFQHKNLIRKQLEERLIKEKVLRNKEKQEKAFANLLELKNKRQQASNDYDALKEKWEKEFECKDYDKKARHQVLMDKVIKDFLERKGEEKCKWEMRDACKLWARERLVAAENYEQECDRKSLRRQQAEEVQLYNRALASERACQVDREQMVNNAWAEKIKGEYFKEMQEMKDYASSCIRDWQGKGRSTVPMHIAMKKWEYDSAMHPRMFRQYEEQKRREGCDPASDPSGFALTGTKQRGETTRETSRRLGFC